MRKPGAPLVCALLLLGLGFAQPGRATEPSEPSEPTPEVGSGEDFDPWQGIDRNGRIPKVPIPPGIENPERWRYIPEGHLKPGNVIQRLLVSSLIIPYVYRSGDVGTGFGLALTDIDFRLQRRREYLGAFASYTTRKQQDYVLSWRRWLHNIDLEGGGVLQEERSFVRAKAGYRKTLTRRFFGFGPDTLEDDESSYTDEVFLPGTPAAPWRCQYPSMTSCSIST